ncbi:metalloregulator ArsR/SmtB family transcription factor [Niallia sp. XMNu-256]|uniref:helix-turn-helix transcriptional regulator n=1 Tax=Niallia sp. XMNu-256 TaxID=3082444 RepID=UPI0030D45A96
MEYANKSTKDKILQLLKKKVSLSVNELSDYLTITHMAVRKHLSSLERDGFISSKEMKQPIGRPLQVYFLTEIGEKLFPKNYEGITIEFLHDLKELYGEEAVIGLFETRENRLTNEYSQKIKSESIPDKVKELVDIQNEKGYMADMIQVDQNTYKVIEHNCPILSVANQFKIACQCETQLLRNVLKTDNIERTTCKTDGDHHCTFLISFP